MEGARSHERLPGHGSLKFLDSTTADVAVSRRATILVYYLCRLCIRDSLAKNQWCNGFSDVEKDECSYPNQIVSADESRDASHVAGTGIPLGRHTRPTCKGVDLRTLTGPILGWQMPEPARPPDVCSTKISAVRRQEALSPSSIQYTCTWCLSRILYEPLGQVPKEEIPVVASQSGVSQLHPWMTRPQFSQNPEEMRDATYLLSSPSIPDTSMSWSLVASSKIAVPVIEIGRRSWDLVERVSLRKRLTLKMRSAFARLQLIPYF